MTFVVRRIEARDERRWRRLWDGYTRFYEREPRTALTSHTWARIMDPTSSVYAIVAEGEDQGVVGTPTTSFMRLLWRSLLCATCRIYLSIPTRVAPARGGS
jgi:hypothetical protein